MRRPIKKKHKLQPDPVYNSVKVTKLINYVMRDGKKETARKIVYMAFDEIKKNPPTIQTKKAGSKEVQEVTISDPMEVFETAIKNVAPTMEVRSRRVGGANYQVPVPVRPERQLTLALRWIVQFAKSKTGSPMYKKLADEIRSAAKEEGEAVTKRINTHKMAEANKAFAHFAW